MSNFPPKLRIGIFTYNVLGIPPKKIRNVDKWIVDGPRKKLHRTSDPSKPLDIYVIGLQEAVQLNPVNALNPVGQRTENVNKEWLRKLKTALTRLGTYNLLTTEFNFGIHLFVFVKSNIYPALIRDMSRGSIATGVGNIFADKGAVGVRVNAGGKTMCFVCCHLASGCGPKQLQERNDDFHRIARNFRFLKGGTISDHEYVFVFGDLNYRLCGNRTGREMKKEMKTLGLGPLLAQDELIQQQTNGEAFYGFSEMPITFKPTYKFEAKSDKYSKPHLMAWTDRVTWRVKDSTDGVGSAASTIQPLVYDRAEIKTSDHRPVFAVFDVSFSGQEPAQACQPASGLQQSYTHLPPLAPLADFVQHHQCVHPGLQRPQETVYEVNNYHSGHNLQPNIGHQQQMIQPPAAVHISNVMSGHIYPNLDGFNQLVLGPNPFQNAHMRLEGAANVAGHHSTRMENEGWVSSGGTHVGGVIPSANTVIPSPPGMGLGGWVTSRGGFVG